MSLYNLLTTLPLVLTKPNHKGRFNELFPLAQRKLKDTFGMELVQMRAKESSSSKCKFVPESQIDLQKLTARLFQLLPSPTCCDLLYLSSSFAR